MEMEIRDFVGEVTEDLPKFDARLAVFYQMRRKSPCFSYGDIRRSPLGEMSFNDQLNIR
ncbi:hypothetical protein [Alicyclobacillus fodiniaquatilis]|uniref:Uncharacterized protein n=1 Tax=Alicyclobacillus fodiniaquatilis TaxID=1661150 RepID=A0ABW4JLX7_9BACL